MTQLIGVPPLAGEQVQIGRAALVNVEPQWFLVDDLHVDPNDTRWALLFGHWLIGSCWESGSTEAVGVFIPGLLVRRLSAAA
jgi:hypothetical protein